MLEAGTVYLLMKKGFPISRNVRAQWVLQHLDTVITIQKSRSNYEELPELEVISVLPKENVHSWSPESSCQYLYKITSSTTIKFLAHKYKIVFSLDLSPSLATVVNIFSILGIKFILKIYQLLIKIINFIISGYSTWRNSY